MGEWKIEHFYVNGADSASLYPYKLEFREDIMYDRFDCKYHNPNGGNTVLWTFDNDKKNIRLIAGSPVSKKEDFPLYLTDDCYICSIDTNCTHTMSLGLCAINYQIKKLKSNHVVLETVFQNKNYRVELKPFK